MNSTLLDLGFLQIKWYSFFIFLAIVIASLIIRNEAKKKKMDDDTLIDLLFYGLIIGILGARIYYVLFNLDYYLNNASEIFMIWNGGLAIHGGIISALIFLFVYCRKKRINFPLTIDLFIVGLPIGQAIGRWGNFFNQEAFGRVIELAKLKSMHLPQFIINGMYIDGKYREPTFLYESISSLLCFITLIILRKTKKLNTGQLTSVYLIWYGIIRFIIEGLRSDSLMFFGFKIAQIISMIFVLAGIILFMYAKRNNKYERDVI